MLNQCERVDPRVLRTKKLLHQALEALLGTKDFESISVQDIAREATLNRATFYAHYNDKLALLQEWIRIDFLQLLAERNVRYDSSCVSAFRAVISALCAYVLGVQKLHSSGQLQFDRIVEATVIDQIRLVLLDGFRSHSGKDGRCPELVCATASWAVYGAVKQWVNTPARLPDDDFIDLALELVGPILARPIQAAAQEVNR